MERTIRFDEPLSRHTALRVGGRCDAWVVAHDEAGLEAAIADCVDAEWPWTLMGAGTRTLVRDGGIEGVVFRLGPALSTLSVDGETWSCGAGAPMPALLAAAARAGQTGLESLAGIPGSVGASLIHDSDRWGDVVETVRILRRGRVREVDLPRLQSRGRVVVLSVRLRLRPDDPELVRARMGRALRRPNLYDPEPASVRQCLRRAELIGVRLRGIAIPGSAPEMVVNLGGGTASDLALLHRSVRDRVKREQGIDLGTTLRWTGSLAPATPAP